MEERIRKEWTPTEMTEPRIDWDSLYKDFTQGWWVTDFRTRIHKIHYPEVAELAEKYECSKKTIYDRISKDRLQGIGDWRKHRQSIQAKRKEEAAGENGGRFGLYVTESAKLDAIALDTLEQIMTLVRLETKLMNQQRSEDIKQIEKNPEAVRLIKYQSQALQMNARTIASVMETLRKVVGEPVTGIATQADVAANTTANTAASTNIESSKSEIDKLFKQWERLSKRAKKLGDNAG